jgi:hypothetical protein
MALVFSKRPAISLEVQNSIAFAALDIVDDRIFTGGSVTYETSQHHFSAHDWVAMLRLTTTIQAYSNQLFDAWKASSYGNLNYYYRLEAKRQVISITGKLGCVVTFL